MNPWKKALIGSISLLPLAAMAAAAPAEDENARLRLQVEQLKTEIEAAKEGCGAGPQAPLAIVSPAATTAAPAAAAAAAAAANTAAPEAPSGYKLIKVEPVVPLDTRWKDDNAWDALIKGMSKQEVETLLGVDHTINAGGNRTFWGYGKTGVIYAGSVIFVDDRLAIWTRPDR